MVASQMSQSRPAHLRKGHMAHTLVVWVGLEVAPVLNVVEVLDVVLLCHLPQDVDVSVGTWVCCEDVMVWNEHDTLIVPHLQTVDSPGHSRASAQYPEHPSVMIASVRTTVRASCCQCQVL